MLKIENNGIAITRGDSLRLMIRLDGRDIAEGAKALFTVKDTPWEPCAPVVEKLIDIMDGSVSILLTPAETDITPGHYVWDLRIKEPAQDGRTEVLTPMEYAAFKVMEVIGDEQ